jgi:hypothetical protein
MKRRPCVNCQAWANGPMCWDCVRLVLVTVVAELLVAVILWAVR